MIIQFDRSSVCMGDDCESHAEVLETDGDTLLSRFIKFNILKRLALISGGKATWVLRIKGNDREYKNIAVMAQQWKDAKLLIHDCKMKELCINNKAAELFALYYQQEDPNTVFSKLANNR